jgi:hypothetical protein
MTIVGELGWLPATGVLSDAATQVVGELRSTHLQTREAA